ncbi:glycosyltransferase [Pontimicrobium sp. IMCC45349]|uniref:cellulose synthase family protein n=1 Tax=Pontimicrobium sp. IMCC45349 TaxID=3391574 RepID=UPI0039A09E17
MIGQLIFYFWMLLNILLFLYVLVETVLLIFALKAKKKNKHLALTEFPKVTVQLPVYNEKYVIERLIDAVSKLNYPKDKLEIQVLDDSNDETSTLIKNKVDFYTKEGIDIIHVQRKNRTGYKAGALDYGMQFCKGEFIAIFDADFIPDSEFLMRAIPYFNTDKIGVVQTRWAHINEKFSFITRAQAIMLNTHFSVEHLGRISSGAFINFNGTAGIWRKSCIEDAGGWHADTLTEDLDLSFRAQTKGWKFNYLFDVESPAELPVTIDAYKTQQFRWSKGAAECVKKNTKMLWKSNANFWAKLAGTIHLLNSSIFIIVFFLVLTSPIVFWLAKQGYIMFSNINVIPFISLFVTICITLLFLFGHLMVAKSKWKEALLFIPNFYVFLALSVSISLYMVIGVIEGYLGKVSEFVRTPKFNLVTTTKTKPKDYAFKKEHNITVLELMVLSFGVGAFALGCYYQDFFMANYGFIISLGYSLKVFMPKYVFRF